MVLTNVPTKRALFEHLPYIELLNMWILDIILQMVAVGRTAPQLRLRPSRL